MTERFSARRMRALGLAAAGPAVQRASGSAGVTAAIAGLLLAASTLPASASFDAFIRFLGPTGGAASYQGESTDQQFPAADGWSSMLSFQQGIVQTVATTGGGSPSLKIEVLPLNFVKGLDRGTPALFQACATGGHYGTAELVLRKRSADETLKPFYRAVLKEAVIVAQDWSAGGEQVIESVSVRFGAIQWTYNVFDSQGAAASTTVHWDILANEGGFGPLPGQLPEITCPAADVVVNAAPGSCSAPVLFSVEASNDAGVVPVECAPPAGSAFAKGSTAVHCTATDADGFSVDCSFQVVVNDAEAPSITGESVDKPTLWPPDQKMHDVTVAYAAADNCGAVTTSLSVSSNEPVAGVGPGAGSPDFVIIDAHHVQLRAERAPGAAGRTYTITIAAVDSAGNHSARNVTVTVPRNNIPAPSKGGGPR